MLDIADNLVPFLMASELELNEALSEQLAFYLATNKDELSNLLKGVVKKPKTSESKPKKKAVNQD